MVNVLQQLIKSSRDLVRHPLVDDAPCPVLQYEDDTLVVIRGEFQDILNLKIILDRFAAATGLRINYSQSTAVPIHMIEATASQ